MGIKLYVDDIRACPEGWVPAKTVTEAIHILSTVDVSCVSLDHDIQCSSNGSVAVQRRKPHASKETFEAVALHIKALNTINVFHNYPQIEVKIHTGNYEGGRRMADILGINYDPMVE